MGREREAGSVERTGWSERETGGFLKGQRGLFVPFIHASLGGLSKGRELEDRNIRYTLEQGSPPIYPLSGNVLCNLNTQLHWGTSDWRAGNKE